MIELKCVYKKYKRGLFFSKSYVDVLECVSLYAKKGEHLGIIGESGAGKSTLSRVLSLLELPDKGKVYINGEEITRKNISKKRGIVGMVFQDPSTSLDPKMTILSTLREASANKDEIDKVLCEVGLRKELLNKRPYELSGGEQQRVAIARVLLANSEYFIFDEFTSALDVSTQAKIINLLCNINKNRDYGFIFVSHDVKLIGFLSDRVYVLYKGRVVEETKDLSDVKHPYTKVLLKGEIDGSDSFVDAGCSFYGFCPYRMEKCMKEKPELKKIGEYEKVRCFLYD